MDVDSQEETSTSTSSLNSDEVRNLLSPEDYTELPKMESEVEAEEGEEKEKEGGEEEARVKKAETALTQGKVEAVNQNLGAARTFLTNATETFEILYGDNSSDKSHANSYMWLAKVLTEIQGSDEEKRDNVSCAVVFWRRSRQIWFSLVSKQIENLNTAEASCYEDHHDLLLLSNLQVQTISALIRMAERRLERLMIRINSKN